VLVAGRPYTIDSRRASGGKGTMMAIECKFNPAQAVRETLPTRRANSSFSFEHEGHQYRATAGRFADGRLAEIFLHAPGKMGTALQSNADTAAILASLLLQHGVTPEVIRHSITGPIAIALQTFMGEAAS
jgi:hypothetical protein